MDKLTKIILAIILICATVQVETLAQDSDAPYVSRAQFTTRISNNEPVSDLSNIETDFNSVFFFTELMNCDDCNFVHIWSYNGVEQFAVRAYSEWPRYRYWSSVELKPSFVGTWTVEMVVEDELFVEKSFTYYKPTEEQEQKQGIEQRLERSGNSECEENLRYFSDQAAADPDEPYFEFMLKKWGDRCLK